MTTLLCLNPHSRSGEIDPGVVTERLAPLGEISVSILGEEHTIQQAVEAFEGNLERVVVGGGDGTLNAALAALIAAEVPMGILPLGTANDFAKSLRLPDRLEEAIDIILEGHTRSATLGQANGHLFLNAAGIGVGPQLTKTMSEDKKEKLGVLAYFVSLFQVISTRWRKTAVIRLDGKRKGMRYMQITIAKGRHYGGGLTVAEDAEVEDDFFRVLCIKPQSLLDLLGNFIPLRWGTKKGQRDREGMKLLTAKEVSVFTRTSTDVTLDGELITSTPLTCKIMNKTLEVYAPRPPDDDTPD